MFYKCQLILLILLFVSSRTFLTFFLSQVAQLLSGVEMSDSDCEFEALFLDAEIFVKGMYVFLIDWPFIISM